MAKKNKMNTSFIIHEDMQREEMKGLGGTDAKEIVNGNWKDLWEIKTGKKPPVDLSDVLPVQLGIVTEDFNREWFTKETQIQVLKPGIIQSKLVEFLYASVDGITDSGCIFEAKHVSPFSFKDVTHRYYPQIQHYLMVTRFQKAYLSVLIGNSQHKIYEIERDDEFIKQMFYAECMFWNFVMTNVQPPDFVAFEQFKGDGKIVENNLTRIYLNGEQAYEFELPNSSWLQETEH